MSALETFIAVNRFGLGPAPADLGRIDGDPRGWAARQVKNRVPVPAPLRAFSSSRAIARDIHRARASGDRALAKSTRRAYREQFRREVVARFRWMVGTDQPLNERMVLFWSNHFTVSRTKAIVGPVIPAYEREAVRPHVFGRFADLLKATTGHIAMLAYLDNVLSIGPDSRIGRRSGRGLNENLAREILELHTLGVNGGYSQKDVTEFAAALTGWTHDGIRAKRAPGTVEGRVVFREAMHQPGSKTVLGKRYAEAGADEARAILDDLARHPSTARHVATRLVRHFVNDTPPPEDIERIASVFMATDGDLAAVTRAVIDLDSVWREPLPKVKSPRELVLATFRALAVPKPPPRALMVALTTLGQQPFNAPSPQGWPDEASHWLAPQALLRRIEWLRAVATKAPVAGSPTQFLDRTIGPVASRATREMVANAPSAEAGIALVLASAEFQRR